jgi:GNAT superfamily N-acetyltransferase
MDDWTVQRAGGAEEFSALAGPLLSRHPVAANVLLTVLDHALAGRFPFGEPLWLLARDPAGRVGGAAMRTGSFPLFLPPQPGPAVDALVGWAHRQRPDLDGVNAPTAEGRRFAAGWQRLTGCTVRTLTAQRMHELRRLLPPAGVPGRARPAGADDVALCTRWLVDFGAEADVLQTAEQTRRLAPQRVASGTLQLWQDGHGRPVALAGWHPPVHGVGRVGPVYTPPEHRNHGYGSAVTAAATQAVLDAGGERAMLYTDLANPVSNAIYARLGYTPVLDAAVLRFE